jgi:hypothetical protein
MSRLPEQRLYDTFRRSAQKFAPRLWIQRIENTTVSGMPDIMTISKPSEGARITFIELKVAAMPKKATSKPKGLRVRLSQSVWLRKATVMGVAVVVLLRIGPKRIYSIPSSMILSLEDLTVLDLACYETDWESFIKQL